MAMDDTFALYGGRDAGPGLEDIVVKGFVNYTYDTGVGTGYGGGASVQHMRFEDVHFVSNTVDYAIWFQLTPRYWTGRGVSRGPRNRQTYFLATMYGLSTARSKPMAGISGSTPGIRP